MPNLYSRKSDCCGCGACVAICPKRCITMVRDDEGFDYPIIDSDECIQCGRCEAVCPWKHEPQLDGRQTPPDVHAAWSLDDEIRRQSSSGGVFTVLATHILAQGGAVVGAAFTKDYHAVEHVIVEDQKGLAHLRGSKYVQSAIPPGLFQTIAEMVRHERVVLFSGCPCQVAGLRLFLGPNQKTLITCDLVCHGVPSPGWFARYCRQLEAKNHAKITDMSFRNKDRGWKHFQLKYTFDNGRVIANTCDVDYYLGTFLDNYSLRHSCYACKYANTTRQGDITLADYWGVDGKYPEYDLNDKGCSLILANTETGAQLLANSLLSMFVGKGDLAHASICNQTLYRCHTAPMQRFHFLTDSIRLPYSQLTRQYRLCRPSLMRRAMRKANSLRRKAWQRFLCRKIT